MSASSLLNVLWRLGSFAGSLLLTLLGLTAVTFGIGRFIPVDPVLAVVGDHATREVYDKARLAMGLDRSVPEQYFLYLKKLVSGDFGTSVMTSHSILSDIVQFFPATLELSTIAAIIGVSAGVPAGVAAAAYKGRWPDQLVRIVGLFGYSMPASVGLLALDGLMWASRTLSPPVQASF
jgi:peptide/nickel transport system permease protein